MDFSQLALADWMFNIGIGFVIGGIILLVRSYTLPRGEGRSG